MPTLSDKGLHWIFVLSTTLVFALLGVLLPNLFAQISLDKRRAHNKIKFANEFLGRHQLSYITYLLGIGFTSEFKLPWMRDFLTFFTAVTFLSYLIGAFFVHTQDRMFQAHHCTGQPTCNTALTTWEKFRMIGYNSIAGPALLIVSIAVAFAVSK